MGTGRATSKRHCYGIAHACMFCVVQHDVIVLAPGMGTPLLLLPNPSSTPSRLCLVSSLLPCLRCTAIWSTSWFPLLGITGGGTPRGDPSLELEGVMMIPGRSNQWVKEVEEVAEEEGGLRPEATLQVAAAARWRCGRANSGL